MFKALLLQAATGVVHPPKKMYSRLQKRVEAAIAAYGRTEILVISELYMYEMSRY